MEAKRRQLDRVVSISDLQSGCPAFESRSGDLYDLSSVILSSNRWTLCKKPTGCLLPVGVFNPVIYVVVNFLSQVIFLFLLFLGMLMYANGVETKEK